MKKCNSCGVEKELKDYHRAGKSYRGSCKQCVLKKHHPKIPKELWKPNAGHFKKGVIPKTAFVKGQVSLYKGKKHTEETKKIIREKALVRKQVPPNKGQRTGNCRWNLKAKDWSNAVKERDGYECKKCGSKDRLDAHHVIPWRKSKELRYDLNNGITLCKSCHAKEEGFKNGHTFSDETLKKMSESHKGQIAWNKGKKMSDESRRRMSESAKGRIPWNKGMKKSKEILTVA